eukprot:143884-Rhodomonas_salina.4
MTGNHDGIIIITCLGPAAEQLAHAASRLTDVGEQRYQLRTQDKASTDMGVQWYQLGKRIRAIVESGSSFLRRRSAMPGSERAVAISRVARWHVGAAADP